MGRGEQCRPRLTWLKYIYMRGASSSHWSLWRLLYVGKGSKRGLHRISLEQCRDCMFSQKHGSAVGAQYCRPEWAATPSSTAAALKAVTAPSLIKTNSKHWFTTRRKVPEGDARSV